MKLHFEDGIQISDLLAIVSRRWRFVALCVAGVLAVSAFVTWNQRAIYRATTKVMMGQTLVKTLLPEQTNPYESYFLQRLSFETQLHVIKSDPVAERVVRRLNLVPADAGSDELRAAAIRVKNAIMVDRIPDTRLFQISVVDTDAERARDIANASAEVYIAMSQERKFETTRRSITWLSEEIARLEGNVRGLEEEMIDYLQDENVGGAGTADVEPRGSLYGDGAGGHPSNVESLTVQLTAAEIALNQLLQRYLDKHPKVVAKRSEIAALQRKITEGMESNSQQSKRMIQYNIKRRESDLNKEMMGLLMKKLKEMDLTGGLAENNISVVETAQLPAAPISPNKKRNMTIGAVLGLLLGLGLAFYLEVFDKTIQSHEEAERFLKTPVLGSVFFVKPTEDLGNPFMMTAAHPTSPESEMFRTLRTNLKFSRPDGPFKTLLITSSGPEEGKSTVSSNLGITLASSMKKTLIVDTDFRKPSMQKAFGLKNSKGMVEVLVGEAEIDEVVQPTSIKNLYVIPRGSKTPNPAELLDSENMRGIIEALKEKFDFIIFDSPPVGSVVDASILGTLVDGTVLVVEVGRFEARFIQRAKDQIETARGHVLGIVLNKSHRQGHGYYYQQYYAYQPETEGSSATS